MKKVTLSLFILLLNTAAFANATAPKKVKKLHFKKIKKVLNQIAGEKLKFEWKKERQNVKELKSLKDLFVRFSDQGIRVMVRRATEDHLKIDYATMMNDSRPEAISLPKKIGKTKIVSCNAKPGDEGFILKVNESCVIRHHAVIVRFTLLAPTAKNLNYHLELLMVHGTYRN